MSLKRTSFSLPYLGFDYGAKHGWNYDVLIDQHGLPVVGLSIQNLVEQYAADQELYLGQHRILSQIVGILGEGFTLQKLDLFSRALYRSELLDSDPYLKKKYRAHFQGRSYQALETLLLFSPSREGHKSSNWNKSSLGQYKALRDKVQKIFLLLESSELRPKFLFATDFETKVLNVLSMNFCSVPSWDNILCDAEYLRVGEKYVKVFSLVDVEKVELPSEVKPFSELSLSGSLAGGSGAAVDRFSFLHQLSETQSLVYNQILCIPFQGERQRVLEKKRKKHEGVASSAASNGIIADEIQDFLLSIASEGELIVDAHFSITVSCSSLEALEKTQSQIEQKLFNQGILISKNAYNQLELFRAALPGNAAELKPYDLFTTSSSAALCFFFNERYAKNEASDFYLEFTDRQGVPLRIDPSDLPMQSGRISNRNKFVLGPSGSGKSFLMNSLVEQYLNYNYDVVIVDTGDSYKGLSLYKQGRYVQYTEKNPITMNPFKIAETELTLEKVEFLTSLVFMIWQGSDFKMSSAQKSILDKLVLSYYEHYFKTDFNQFESRSTQDLLEHLKDFGIELSEILSKSDSPTRRTSPMPMTDSDGPSRRQKTQYKNPKSASTYQVDPEFSTFELNEAVLPFEALRKEIRNEESRILNTKQSQQAAFPSSGDLESLRPLILEAVRDLESEFFVKYLGFNSFYEYAQVFLPRFLRGKTYEISEREFSLSTFFLVLRDFYKGGRYARTLNEAADQGLFEDPFIVFEIDSIKDNPKLFPIVTLIIMDTFIQKMRFRKNRRKALIIEEAWKAIASELMGNYILYLYKTVRKFYGEAIVVTQELDDVISSPVVKDSILNNSDTLILLDQTKFKDNFARIALLLSLNAVEQSKLFTLNQLDNKEGRSRFKEFYLRRGSTGEVYGNEVSIEQYLTYTTEKPEKTAVEIYLDSFESFEAALDAFVADLKNSGLVLSKLVEKVNTSGRPLRLLSQTDSGRAALSKNPKRP